jgi:hypothetical protein
VKKPTTPEEIRAYNGDLCARMKVTCRFVYAPRSTLGLMRHHPLTKEAERLCWGLAEVSDHNGPDLQRRRGMHAPPRN